MVAKASELRTLAQKWFRIWKQEGIFDTYFGYNSIQYKMPSETKYAGNGVKFKIKEITKND